MVCCVGGDLRGVEELNEVGEGGTEVKELGESREGMEWPLGLALLVLLSIEALGVESFAEKLWLFLGNATLRKLL